MPNPNPTPIPLMPKKEKTNEFKHVEIRMRGPLK